VINHPTGRVCEQLLQVYSVGGKIGDMQAGLGDEDERVDIAAAHGVAGCGQEPRAGENAAGFVDAGVEALAARLLKGGIDGDRTWIALRAARRERCRRSRLLG
jgi:hypothetical protein